MAEAGELVGNGWLKWITCELDRLELWPLLVLGCGVPVLEFPFAAGAMDWMVVKVVASERTDGAGDENVLSPPRRDSMPPLTVLLVPATEDAPCDTAVTDRDVSWSVEIVGAMDRDGGGDRPSSTTDDLLDPWLDSVIDVLPLLAVEIDGRSTSVGSTMPILLDCG